MAEPRGAGRAGGLLFLAIAIFVGFLIIKAALGLLIKLVLTLLVIGAIVGLLANVLRRR